MLSSSLFPVSFMFLLFVNAEFFGHTPCTYPVPSDQRYRDVCSPYLDVEFICDIDGVVSKTAAEQIRSAIDKYDCFKSSLVTVAVAAMQVLSVPQELPVSDLLVSSDWFCFTEYSTSLNEILRWNNASSVDRYVDLFGTVLRRRWFRTDCGSQLMFLTVTDHIVDANNAKVVTWPVVHVSFGQALYSHLGAAFCEELTKSVSTWHKEGLAPTVTISSALDIIGQRYEDLTDEATKRHAEIPVWAIGSFFACFATVGFCVFLDYFIVRRKALALRGAKGDDGRMGGGAPQMRKSENVSVHLLF